MPAHKAKTQPQAPTVALVQPLVIDYRATTPLEKIKELWGKPNLKTRDVINETQILVAQANAQGSSYSVRNITRRVPGMSISNETLVVTQYGKEVATLML